MPRIVFPLVAAALLIGEGLYAGRLTNRWQDSTPLPAAVASLQRVPWVIGDWQGQPLPAFDDRTCVLAGFAGHLHRRYENSRNGAVVQVLLGVGAFGPISVHTPEVCFAGGGYIQQGKTVAHDEVLGMPDGGAHFWMGHFAKPAAMPNQIQAYWTWKASNSWQAPDNARWTFAGAPVLYKLYVTHQNFGEEDRAANENCGAFLRALIPELDKCLAFSP